MERRDWERYTSEGQKPLTSPPNPTTSWTFVSWWRCQISQSGMFVIMPWRVRPLSLMIATSKVSWFLYWDPILIAFNVKKRRSQKCRFAKQLHYTHPVAYALGSPDINPVISRRLLAIGSTKNTSWRILCLSPFLSVNSLVLAFRWWSSKEGSTYSVWMLRWRYYWNAWWRLKPIAVRSFFKADLSSGNCVTAESGGAKSTVLVSALLLCRV